MTRPSPSGLSEAEQARALERFQILRPFLEGGIPLARVARDRGLVLRTARRWVDRYRRQGLAGLSRKERSDKDRPQFSATLRQAIEGLALQKPRRSAAAIHRQAVTIAERLGETAPSYSTVYAVIRDLDPGLVTLAHEGTKAYADAFDLVHRHEAAAPNAVWQADHTELDVWLRDGSGRPEKPWLTIILDDYSRAVAGYALSFSAPSAIHTALALRQAIWRKGRPGWQVCGIPGILYSDHGSDFTSRHLEQVAADLEIRLVNSGVGRPRGRGKIERFFESVSQVLLPRLPGYGPGGAVQKAELTLAEMTAELERFLVDEYHDEPHTTTGFKPHERWTSGGFLPRLPESLEQLDLLLLTVPKARRVHRDGLRFSGLRYIDPTLAAYVGEEVLLRYDPRDVAEVRVFHDGRFVCRAVCQELAGETVPLREVIRARDRRRRELRRTIQDRRKAVESLLEVWRCVAGARPDRRPMALRRSSPNLAGRGGRSSGTPMTDATGTAFVETREYRRFREFCDACRRYRYIGLRHGPPGVGKTLSARRCTDWGRVESADPYADRGVFGPGEVPGNGGIFYTAKVVNSPGQIEGEIASLRGRMRELVLQGIRGEEGPRIAAAQRKLDQERAEYLSDGDWFAEDAPRLRAAEGAVSEAILGRAERSRRAGDPTGLIVIDEADRIRMAGLEQVRDIFDRGGVGVVLIGMPGLERRLTRYAQLYSRIGFVHEFRPLVAAQVRTVLGDRRPPEASLPEDLLADADGVAALIRATGGNFRLLHRLLSQVGRILEINGLGSVTREVVEAAREVLVIGAA